MDTDSLRKLTEEKSDIKNNNSADEIKDAHNLAVNDILKIFIKTLMTLFRGLV